MDAYTQHLAAVNEVHNVVAAEDIRNSQGQVLVRKGAAIDGNMAEKVAKFKLLRPIEHSVIIENELEPSTLIECFDSFFQSDPSLANVYQAQNNPADLQKYCDYFCKYPLLRQKITVISLLMPSVFEQAMFCAWFGTIICKDLPETAGKERDVFVAALCHDIGMVHISADVLNKQEELTADEWKQIQAHPVISFNILKETPGVSKLAIQAVLEHHENLDGTGYPRGKVGSQLCHEGQLLNLLDSVNAIYNKHFKPHNRPINEIIPIIQMNRHSRYGSAGKRLIMLLRSLPALPGHSIPDDLAPEAIAAVKAHNAYIERCINITADIAADIGFRHNDASLASIQNAIIHLTVSISQSGIANEAYMRWLDQVAKERLSHAYKEVEEAFLMMQEIIYHIDRLKRQINLFLHRKGATPMGQKLAKHLEHYNNESPPQIDALLKPIWMFSL